MRFKSEGYARPGERPGERACVCLFVPRRNQRAKLQKAFWFVVFTSRTADTDAEQTRAGFLLPIWTLSYLWTPSQLISTRNHNTHRRGDPHPSLTSDPSFLKGVGR